MRNSRNRIKPVMSVGEMAEALGHSRARFWQLQKQQIYPSALYDIRTKRPYFDARLQKICFEVRETGIGCNGHLMLFYSSRNASATRSQGIRRPKVKNKEMSSEHKELVETLGQMGIEATGEQVCQVVQKLYPDGLENRDMGVVIREVFCNLRKSV